MPNKYSTNDSLHIPYYHSLELKQLQHWCDWLFMQGAMATGYIKTHGCVLCGDYPEPGSDLSNVLLVLLHWQVVCGWNVHTYVLHFSKLMDTFYYQKHNNHLHPSMDTCSTIGLVSDMYVLVSWSFTILQVINQELQLCRSYHKIS